MPALLHSFCMAVLKEFIVWQVTVLLSSLFQMFIALCGKECSFLLVRHRVFFILRLCPRVSSLVSRSNNYLGFILSIPFNIL